MMRCVFLLLFLACSGLSCRSSTETAAPAPGSDDRPSIAVVPFGIAPGTPSPPVDVAAVIRGDLAADGRLALVEAGDLPARPTRLAEVRAEDWRRSPVDYLVVGMVARVHDGGHEIEFQLVDPGERRSLVGHMMPSAPDSLEQTAHEIAAVVSTRLGDAGR